MIGDPADALGRLRAVLGGYSALVVGYSGGVDSALLAVVAADVLGPRLLAVTAVSSSLAASERAAAREFARQHRFRQLEVCTDELSRPEYVANDGNRCFHCKSALLDALQPLAELLDARVAIGTNVDDLSDHRPGQRAAGDRGAVAPLVEAGLGKAAVRAVSRLLGLSTADKVAAACLASRVAYAEPVTEQVLGRIERAEQAVRELGYREFRIRAHGNGTVARAEFAPAELDRAYAGREELAAACRAAGFLFAALDLQGFRSGSMNRMLPISEAGR